MFLVFTKLQFHARVDNQKPPPERMRQSANYMHNLNVHPVYLCPVLPVPILYLYKNKQQSSTSGLKFALPTVTLRNDPNLMVHIYTSKAIAKLPSPSCLSNNDIYHYKLEAKLKVHIHTNTTGRQLNHLSPWEARHHT